MLLHIFNPIILVLLVLVFLCCLSFDGFLPEAVGDFI